MNELIKKKGFRLGAVAEAIGVSKNTINRWDGNAPIEKLFRIANFTGIPIADVIECFNPDRPTDIEDSSDQN